MAGSDDIAEQLRTYIKGRMLTVKVIPRASKTEFAGTDSKGMPRIRLKAVPEKGAANRELVKYLSKVLKADVHLMRGARGRTKTLQVIP